MRVRFGSGLRDERQRARLSQSEVAALAGTTRHAVALLEKGGGRVSTLLKVQQQFPVHITLLASGDDLAQRIKATRLKKNLSLADLASRAEVAINTVRSIEAGGGSVDALWRIIKALEPKAEARVGTRSSGRRGLVTLCGTSSRTRITSDHYPTPAPIVRLLLDHENFTREHPILEPAVGTYRVIERVLNERGYKRVICSDINGCGSERRDFLHVTERYHTVVTNPPYSLHREFVHHAKSVATHKIAMLLPLNNLTGAARHAELWSDEEFPLARLWVLSRGIDFIRSEPLGGTFHPSQLYCGWFVFEREHQGPPMMRWIDSNPWVTRSQQRVSET